MKSPVYECDRCRRQFTTCTGYAKRHGVPHDPYLTRVTTVTECFHGADRYRLAERMDEDPVTGATRDGDLAAELSAYKMTVESAQELLHGRPDEFELCTDCHEQLQAFMGGEKLVSEVREQREAAKPKLVDTRSDEAEVYDSGCGSGYIACECVICVEDPKGEWAAKAVEKMAREREGGRARQKPRNRTGMKLSA